MCIKNADRWCSSCTLCGECVGSTIVGFRLQCIVYNILLRPARCQANNCAKAWKGRDLSFDGVSCQACWFFIFYTRTKSGPLRARESRRTCTGDWRHQTRHKHGLAPCYSSPQPATQKPAVSVRSSVVERFDVLADSNRFLQLFLFVHASH